MVYVNITEDGRFLKISGEDMSEIDRIRNEFVKKIPNWFILKRKYPHMDIEESFINDDNMIPSGLWMELVNVCKSNSISVDFVDGVSEILMDECMSRDAFDSYIDSIFTDDSFKMKGYQIDSAFLALKYRKCCIEVSTSGGKTVISYAIFRYMIDCMGVKHILYITPSTNLTTQSGDKFVFYDDEKNNLKTDWSYNVIHSKAKKKDSYNETIIFGNYQSLCRKSESFFEMFDAVIIDECHHAKSKSILNIRNKCVNAKYVIGMTGTFPKNDGYDGFVIQGYIGPIVYKLTQYELINVEKFATPVHIVSIELDYLENEKKMALYDIRCSKNKDNSVMIGSKSLNIEREICRSNPLRFEYITNMISSTTKNSLVIFFDIQTGYGVNVYHRIKDTTDKNVYYIDGSTKSSVRDEIKEAMEEDNSGNTIIVASIGCFSEGIDICNLWNIFLIESTKSVITLSQIIGRGMRKYEGKERTLLIDFVDDFTYGSISKHRENYLHKHGIARQNMYRNNGFPLKIVSVNLMNSVLV